MYNIFFSKQIINLQLTTCALCHDYFDSVVEKFVISFQLMFKKKCNILNFVSLILSFSLPLLTDVASQPSHFHEDM